MKLATLVPHASPRSPSEAIEGLRFTDDVALLEAIRGQDALMQALQRTDVLRRNSTLRARLLSNAVQVNTRLIPHVARSFSRVTERIGVDKPLEAYVFDESQVHAFVSETSRHFLVGLSSGAVNLLDAEELEFVIGHELGHAAFGHLDVAAEAVIELGMVDRSQCKLLRAWQRAAEISADRVGLHCCDSLEVVATALFKSICGLNLPGVSIDPREFAQQWHGLAEEIMALGIRDHWRASHPFPPMRMQALLSFWSGDDRTAIDHEIRRLLAHMGTLDHDDAFTGDPLLSRFNYWGGLFIALADQSPSAQMLREFAEFAPSASSAHIMDIGSHDATISLCMERFRGARQSRREKLSSRELHTLISGFVDVASRRGPPSERAVEHVTRLGQELGIGQNAVRLLINRHLNKDS